MLRDHCAHEQPAVAAAEDRELLRTRPFLFDQVFGRRGEIIEHVLFFGQIAGLVPFFAELAASANVRHDKNAATVEPKPAREVEIRLHADAVAAVAIKQRRIVTVELYAFAANDVQRDFRAVLRYRELPRHFDVGKRYRRRVDQRSLHRLGLSGGHFKPSRRFGVAHVAKEERVVFQRFHFRNGRDF